MQPCSFRAWAFSLTPALPPPCHLSPVSFRVAPFSLYTGDNKSCRGLHHRHPPLCRHLSLIRRPFATKPPPETDEAADDEEKPATSRDEGDMPDEGYLRSETLEKEIGAPAGRSRGSLWEVFRAGFGRKKAPEQQRITSVGEGALDIEWRDLIDPTPENLLALLLTGLLGLAALQILWQVLLVSITITLAAVKYSVIAAILLALLIVFL